jgi:hypothetical protein
MKFAAVQKNLAAVAVSLVFVLAGFTVGLAHGTSSAGFLVTIQLHQVIPGGHAQLDHHNMPFSFVADICALPSPSQSPVHPARTPIAHAVVFIQTCAVTPVQGRSAMSRLFDTVLLI